MALSEESCQRIVDTMFQVLIDGSKQDYIGERISQLDHSLQAAAQALESSKNNIQLCRWKREGDIKTSSIEADEETILAALLHDIGQFATSSDQMQMLCDASALAELDPGAVEKYNTSSSVSVGVTGHERIGAEYLRKLGFSEKIAQLVEAHVPVKRYLTGKDKAYYEGLSAASKLSLKYQVHENI